MMLIHNGKRPKIDSSVYVARNATAYGDVEVGAGSRIMFGACIVAEGQTIRIGRNCIMMENVVVRSTSNRAAGVGDHCLIGPQSHLIGCASDDCVFVATGATVLHGARLGYNSEVRINGVVHWRRGLPAHSVVPIGWVAVGSPARILPPDRQEETWSIQKPLDFPRFVYGVQRAPDGETNMPAITAGRSAVLGTHSFDEILDCK